MGSARNFLASIRTLLTRNAEVDRLTNAVKELKRLAGPGGDLNMFIKVLRLDRPAYATNMEGVDSTFDLLVDDNHCCCHS
jgi:hypothetical protein